MIEQTEELNNEFVDSPENQEIEQQLDVQQEEPVKPKISGWDHFDFDKIEDEQVRLEAQERFKRIYDDRKSKDKENKALKEQLNEMIRKVDSVISNQEQFVQRDKANQMASIEDSLLRKLSNAYQIGEPDEIAKSQAEYSRFLTEKAKLELQQQLEAKKQPASKQVDQRQEYIEFDDDERSYFEQWGQSRPWTNANHPDYESALLEAQVVFNAPRYAHLPFPEKLNLVEQRMSKNTTQNTPYRKVGAANLTQPSNKRQNNLTDKQKEICRRLGISEDGYKKAISEGK